MTLSVGVWLHYRFLLIIVRFCTFHTTIYKHYPPCKILRNPMRMGCNFFFKLSLKNQIWVHICIFLYLCDITSLPLNQPWTLAQKSSKTNRLWIIQMSLVGPFGQGQPITMYNAILPKQSAHYSQHTSLSWEISIQHYLLPWGSSDNHYNKWTKLFYESLHHKAEIAKWLINAKLL